MRERGESMGGESEGSLWGNRVRVRGESVGGGSEVSLWVESQRWVCGGERMESQR